jgi:drug/metabolite transporter (DMT)-like permease
MPIALQRLAARIYGSAPVLLTLCGLFWAGNAIAGRLAIGEIAPLMLVQLRWVLVIAVLWPLYGTEVRAHWPMIRPRIWRIAAMAMLGLTGFNVLFYVAAHTTSAINLGIIQGAMPAFVMLGAYISHGTRVSVVQILGVLVTMLGVVIVATHGAPQALLSVALNRGDLLMLIACVLYAYYTVALRDRPSMPGPVFFTLLSLIAAATSVPLIVYEAVTAGLVWPSWKGLAITAWIAIFPSTLAQLFIMRGVDLIGPGRAGVYVNLVPVFTAIMAVGLISEPFAVHHGVALALVLAGIMLAQRMPSAKVRPS